MVNRYRYDAFGNTVEAKEQIPNRFRYAGEQFDAVTGQYYLRARFYNPVVGRFTQEDTYRGDGLNLYAYVANNPINYVDPSGYCGESKTGMRETLRPALGSSDFVDIVSDYVSPADIQTNPGSPLFYSVPNKNGGRVHVSTAPITQNDFTAIVNDGVRNVDAKNKSKIFFWQKSKVYILTGTHGDLDGNLIPERAFYEEDKASFEGLKNVKVIDITKIKILKEWRISMIMNKKGEIINAWCYSERSKPY